MEISERILLILQDSDLPPAEFAERIGIPRSTLSHIQSGRNKPSLDLVLKIKESFPEYSWDWLLSGIGDKFVGNKNITTDTNTTEFINEAKDSSVSMTPQKSVEYTDSTKIKQAPSHDARDRAKTDVLPLSRIENQSLEINPKNDVRESNQKKHNEKSQVFSSKDENSAAENLDNEHRKEDQSNNDIQVHAPNNPQSSTPESAPLNSQKRLSKKVLLLFTDGTAEVYDI